jgi:hypothetical protein
MKAGAGGDVRAELCLTWRERMKLSLLSKIFHKVETAGGGP